MVAEPDFAKLAAAIAKNVGANDEQQDVSVWLDTGYAPLNAAISGLFSRGLPGGRIIEMFGPESSGKTWLATQVMIYAQRAGGVAGFSDHERSFTASLAEKLGLNLSPGRWIYKRPRTYEESVTYMIRACRAVREAKIIPEEAPIVWVFDSLASMVPEQMVAKDADKVNMNDSLALAKLTSANFKVLALMADELNVTIIFLNQVREKPGVMYGDPTTTPGGKAPKFYASVRIQLGATRLFKGDGDAKEMIGSEVTARIIKNKVNRPWLKAKWRFLFNEDGSGRFALADSLIDFAAEKGLLESTGPRVIWIDGKSYFRSVLAKKLEDENEVHLLDKLIRDSNAKPDEEEEVDLPDDFALPAE